VYFNHELLQLLETIRVNTGTKSNLILCNTITPSPKKQLEKNGTRIVKISFILSIS